MYIRPRRNDTPNALLCVSGSYTEEMTIQAQSSVWIVYIMYTRPRRNDTPNALFCVSGGYTEAMALQTQQVVCLVYIMLTRPRRNNTQNTIVYVSTRYTNCRIWSVVSSFSNLNRWSSSLGLFCHVQKRPMRLGSKIDVEWHSNCYRLVHVYTTWHMTHIWMWQNTVRLGFDDLSIRNMTHAWLTWNIHLWHDAYSFRQIWSWVFVTNEYLISYVNFSCHACISHDNWLSRI